MPFKLRSDYKPQGDQPRAIAELISGLTRGDKNQTLLGVTGSSETYIEKDSTINDEIDRLRHSATHALLTRNDVLIVASVSCIYGLGTAEAYYELKVSLEAGREYPRHKLLRDLVEIQYERNDTDFSRGTFRVKGDTVEIFPAYE